MSLDSEMRDLLFDAACKMLKSGKEREIIKEDEIEGEIRTHFESHNFGSVSGVEFHATVETEHGTGSVKFLVRSVDAAKRNGLKWASFASMEDMIQEVAVRPSRKNAAFN